MNIFFNIRLLGSKLRTVNFLDQLEERLILNNEIAKVQLIKEVHLLNFLQEKCLKFGLCEQENSYKFIFYTEKNQSKLEEFGTVIKYDSNEEIDLNLPFKSHMVIDLEFLIIEENNFHKGKRFYFYKFQPGTHKFFTAALDFGSEASQVINKDFEAIIDKINPAKMGDLIRSFYPNHENFNFGDYIQSSKESDPRAENYLRSIFFYQSANAEDDQNSMPSDGFFKFLTKENEIASYFNDEKHKYKILPNLKLSYIASENFRVDFSNGKTLAGEDFIIKIKRLVLSNFIEALINTNFSDDKGLLLRFTLLYPNIYNQKTINKLYELINNIFLYQLDRKRIIGYEINLLSESDAVFLGIKSKEHKAIKPNKDYIIIDSGKGTTDYSIIRNINDDYYETVFRTGFVGAGNLLTFSFLVALIYDISVNKGINFDMLSKKLLSNVSISSLNAISNKLNIIKANHGSKNKKNTFEKLDLDTVSIDNILDKVEVINDEGKYVAGAIDFIVNKVHEDIKDFLTSNPNTVIFLSGRSFRFDPFLDKMIKKFESKCEKVIFTKDYPKTISLLGAFNFKNLTTTIEGVPRQIDTKDLGSKKRNKISKYLNQIAGIVDKVFDDQDQDNINPENVFMYAGSEIDLSKKEKIVCNHSVYDLPKELLIKYHESEIKSATIRFNGSKNVILYENEVYEMESPVYLPTDEENLLNEFSAFPFVSKMGFVDYFLGFERFLRENYRGYEDLDDLFGEGGF